MSTCLSLLCVNCWPDGGLAGSSNNQQRFCQKFSNRHSHLTRHLINNESMNYISDLSCRSCSSLKIFDKRDLFVDQSLLKSYVTMMYDQSVWQAYVINCINRDENGIELEPYIVYTMDVLSPFISVLRHSDLTLPWQVLSMSWCCPSRLFVVFLACVHPALFLALSVFPGSCLVFSWCDRSMLVSLLWQCLTVHSLLQLS